MAAGECGRRREPKAEGSKAGPEDWLEARAEDRTEGRAGRSSWRRESKIGWKANRKTERRRKLASSWTAGRKAKLEAQAKGGAGRHGRKARHEAKAERQTGWLPTKRGAKRKRRAETGGASLKASGRRKPEANRRADPDDATADASRRQGPQAGSEDRLETQVEGRPDGSAAGTMQPMRSWESSPQAGPEGGWRRELKAGRTAAPQDATPD